jgi:predicted membrane-bound mannosyltransferase
MYMKRTAWIVLAIVAAGLVLRSLRLSWQPIWWDEGYSVYFATESPARMLWLTARDIHPPLYYALLHFWLGIAGGPSPENGRILSILFGGLSLPLQ